MLTDWDLNFIKKSVEETHINREDAITVVSYIYTKDPVTGEPLGEEEVKRIVSAVVTESSTKRGGDEREIRDGIFYKSGDAIFDVLIEKISDIVDDITRIDYDGVSYEIIGIDKKGIGIRNRYDIVGREQT